MIQRYRFSNTDSLGISYVINSHFRAVYQDRCYDCGVNLTFRREAKYHTDVRDILLVNMESFVYEKTPC